MLLRPLLSAACLAALLAAPMPALARGEGDVAKTLADPANQVAATVALTALSEALLDIRVEPLRRAMAAVGDDGARDLPPDARLRDLAGPGAKQLPGEIGRRVPQAMGAAAGVVGGLAAMMPELRAALGRVTDALPKQ